MIASELSALADVYYNYERQCVDTVVLLSNSDFVLTSPVARQRDLHNHMQNVRFDYLPTYRKGPTFTPRPKHNAMFVLPECHNLPVAASIQDVHPRHSRESRRHSTIADWKFVLGSQYWILSKAAVEYLVEDMHVLFLWHFMKHTNTPDESFFQTAIHNHGTLNSTIREGASRYIGARKAGRIIKEHDKQELMSCKYSFARKFESSLDALRITQDSRTTCI